MPVPYLRPEEAATKAAMLSWWQHTLGQYRTSRSSYQLFASTGHLVAHPCDPLCQYRTSSRTRAFVATDLQLSHLHVQSLVAA
eukprot:1659091-Rhodomonas_salina.2